MTINDNYENKFIHVLNWVTWIIVSMFALAGNRFKSPGLMRLAHHMIHLRETFIVYNLEGKSDLKDLATLVENNQI